MTLPVPAPRLFFHSFPRPRSGENFEDTLSRGLNILAMMKDMGLILAPEIVEWDVNLISGGAEQLRILQRRICFTELSEAELPAHSAMFGPIALAFDIAKLRAAGASPVIYAPQGLGDDPLSQIATFCVRGAYHTRAVLRQLQGLKEMSDPDQVAKTYGMPAAPDYKLHLRNNDATGNIVADYPTAASDVQHVLAHVGFNNIPFDQSTGVLSVFLNMFYPTDNTHTGELLSYYRQREWRLIAGDIHFNGRPMGRSLSPAEIERLNQIDPGFWARKLTVDGAEQMRSALALVYDPVPHWNPFQLLHAIHAPTAAIDRVRAIVGGSLTIVPQSE